MELTSSQILAIKRKRGERELSYIQLSRETGINRKTIFDILKRNHTHVNKITYQRLNDWLINQMDVMNDHKKVSE